MHLDKLKSAIKRIRVYEIFTTSSSQYLVAEGYADTNESALVIMANMSEEWRQSIVEGDNYDKNRKRAAQRAAERNAARDAGKTGNVPGVGYVTPRRERETYVDAAGTTRHKSGAKMP
jgi:F0F1-type ATP synthase epsilon subunit